jgi:gliding motility-associated-like protein
MVEENNCPSEMASSAVVVEAPLPPPTITCISQLTSVEFVWNQIPGAASYDVAVFSGQTGAFTTDTSYLVTGLAAGDVVSIEVTAIGNGPCGNSTAIANCTADDCPNIAISIDPVANICRDASTVPFNLTAQISGGNNGSLTWSGSGISDPDAGTFDPADASIGANLVTAIYEENGCLFSADLTINVYQTPTASFTLNGPLCENETAIATYTGTNAAGLSLTWNFDGGTATPGIGNGPHTVSWATGGSKTVSLAVANAQGCVSDTFSINMAVSTPLVAPAITCNQSTNSIEFTWDPVANATGYLVSVPTGQTGQLNQTSFLLNNLDPGDEVTIELTVSGDGVCPDVVVESTCFAMDCPDVVIDVAPVAPICQGNASTINLSATVSGGNGGGTATWSGNGIIDPLNGVFDPNDVLPGQHLITYEYDENNCHFEGYTTIEVFDVPSSSFTASQTICITDAANVAYTGNAAPDAIYTWDFDGGNASPGTGPGPQQVNWATAGNHSISLTVEQDGCISTQTIQQVQVDAELQAPVIDCSANTESVQFTWDAVAGASDYTVQVVGGAAANQSGTGYAVSNLQPGDAVTIQVTVNGNTVCPLPTVEASCTAAECPPVEIALTPVAPICLVALTEQINLEAQVANGSGSGTWSGSGTLGNAGIFDPAVAGIGTHTLTYTYNEAANCVFTESMDITVVAPPVADAGSDATLTCQDGEMDVELGGSGSSTGPNIAYDWDASTGPFPGDSTSLHPVVAQAGTYTLTVTHTGLNCSDSDEVAIQASQEMPSVEFTLVPISCFGENDGAIFITGVSGGVPPYLYSFNGSAYSNHQSFANLAPGIYTLSVLDANGCQSTLEIDLQQPQEVNVELVAYLEGDNILRLGDSVLMEALTTPDSANLDLIHWEPAGMVNCDTCIRVTSAPIQATTFTVTIESNGCSDSDEMTIFVKKDRPIYVPNAFSPNGDGQNDVFFIYTGGNTVKQIKSFLVFDRWGETVFQFYRFQPNDPASGWNGSYRGKALDPAVFTWFAEVEFIDGVVEILEGDVMLMN